MADHVASGRRRGRSPSTSLPPAPRRRRGFVDVTDGMPDCAASGRRRCRPPSTSPPPASRRRRGRLDAANAPSPRRTSHTRIRCRPPSECSLSSALPISSVLTSAMSGSSAALASDRPSPDESAVFPLVSQMDVSAGEASRLRTDPSPAPPACRLGSALPGRGLRFGSPSPTGGPARRAPARPGSSTFGRGHARCVSVPPAAAGSPSPSVVPSAPLGSSAECGVVPTSFQEGSRRQEIRLGKRPVDDRVDAADSHADVRLPGSMLPFFGPTSSNPVTCVDSSDEYFPAARLSLDDQFFDDDDPLNIWPHMDFDFMSRLSGPTS